MFLNIESSAMSKPGRRFVSLSLTALTLLTGCSENAPAPGAPLEPVPSPHVDAKPPVAPVPDFPDVSPPGRPDDIVNKTLEEMEFFKRAETLAALLPTLGADALPDVKTALQRMDVNTQIIEVALLARFWSHHEPREAALWASNQAPAAFQTALTLPTLAEWARKDPYTVVEHIQSMRAAPGANTAVEEIALVRGWFYSETPGLENYIRSLGVSQTRQRAIRTLLRSMLDEYGPEHTIAWTEKLADDDHKFRLAAFRQLSLELGVTHLEEAIAWCHKWCDDETMGDGLRKHIAQQWALQDGEGAMDFLAKSPRNAESDIANKWAFRGWYRHGALEMRAWLGEMGPENAEPWMQSMLELVSVDMGHADPLKGLAWANAIKDPNDRRRTTITVLTNWRRKKPEEADAWLDEHKPGEVITSRVRYYGRKRAEIQADPEPGPGKIEYPRLHAKDTELAEYEKPIVE